MFKRFFFMIIAAVLTLAVVLSGCTVPREKTPGPPDKQRVEQSAKEPVKEPAAQPEKKAGDYFPHTVGSTWQYRGEGNEYASFIRKVLYTKGNRAQLSEDNGGTVSAAVFEISGDAVTRIFSRGEEYDGTNYLDEQPSQSVVILKAPLKAGTKWEVPGGTREIVDVDATVDTPAGRFGDCIKVKITDSDITYEYYKDGVGLVMREFISGDTRVTSTLEKFTVK